MQHPIRIATIYLSLCFCYLSIKAAKREIKVVGTIFADMASAVDVLEYRFSK